MVKSKKQFLFNPDDPKKSFDVYIDKDPSDTIPIKYTTVKDVEDTIKKLERLYKQGKYPHKRIWQVGMILKVRLEAMNKYKKTKYPKAKKVFARFKLAERYFKFLSERSKVKGEDARKKLVFKFAKVTLASKKNKSRKNKIRKNKKSYILKKMNNIPRLNQFDGDKRQYLLNKCGLPDIPETSHCFNDATHHTCCYLSKEARDHADRTGNPIGQLSDDVFKRLPKNHPKKKYFEESGERPWCTCFGSKVCGAYSDKGKKTNINFISSPSENKFATKVKSSYGCEEHVRNKFSVMSHGTPGVEGRNNTSCPYASNIEYTSF